MAPRGRPRKVGLKRIDAAVDALRPLGFSKDLICKTVNNLLKIYEGNDGWVFIEEASYRLVIETILEEQEKALVVKDDSETTEPLAAESAKEVTGVGETTVVPELMITKTGSQEDVSRRDAMCVDHGSWLEQIDRIRPTAICESKRAGEDTQTASSDVQPIRTPILQRRKPCYGWISDDDDYEEEDSKTGLVICQKAGDIRTGMADLGRERKRKTRWDVKPEVM